jgi:carbohydrate-selective porin OprB
MKKYLLFTALILAAVFLRAQTQSEPDKLTEIRNGFMQYSGGLQLSVQGLIVTQFVTQRGLVDWSDKDRENGSVGTSNYYLKLNLFKEFENGGQIFGRIMGGIGNGIDEFLATYSSIADPYNSKEVQIDKLYYLQPFFNDKVKVHFGKFSADYFDKSELETNFLNALFSISPVVSVLGGRMGVSASYAPYDFLAFEYGYFIRDEYNKKKGATEDTLGNVFREGWGGGGISFKPFKDESKQGSYRINFWHNNDKTGFYSFTKDGTGRPELKPQTSWGLQLFAEQKIHENIVLFAKYTNAVQTAARPNIGTNVNQPIIGSEYYFTENPVLKWSWVTGVIINGNFWGRAQDSIGIGMGQVVPDKNWVDDVRMFHPHDFCDPQEEPYDCDPDYDRLWKNFKADRETVFEAYYLFALNENIQIIPLVQYIDKPYGGNAVNKNNKAIQKAFVGGIKMAFSF